MRLTKNKIFSGILIFGLIANLLVLFDIQYFYLRAISSFIFLTTIPGLLIMLMVEIRKIGFWEYLIYVIGLSVAFLMFGGLFVNWTLPLFGIDKPLSLIPLLISFNVFLLTFWLIAYKRNKRISLKIKLPKLDRLNKVFLTIPMIFPVLSILGAIILNNQGPNYLTMIMLGEIAIYVFLVVLFRKKLNQNIYPFAILMMSISLLLMSSLRSWHISGWDIHQEYQMFQLTRENLHWSMSNFRYFRHAYNACLSITILPTVFDSFLKINNEYIFKLLFPLIFSITSLGVYLSFRKYTQDVIMFLACFLFILQIWFIEQMPTLARQEIALLFFTLALLVLFSKNISSILKKMLFLIFGFSMIVSHYSTTYVALGLFVFTYFLVFIFRKTKSRKSFSKIYKKLNLKEKKRESDKKKYYLRGILVLLLILFAFLWYAQLTETSSNLIDFTHKTIRNMGKMFLQEGLRPGIKEILFQPKNFNTPENIQNYVQSTTLHYNELNLNLYDKEEYRYYKTRPVGAELISPIVRSRLLNLLAFSIFRSIRFLINNIFILLGLFYLLFFKLLKKSSIDVEYITISLISTFFIFAIIFVPLASSNYNLSRLYLQALVLLCLPAILGALLVLKFFKKSKYFILSMIFIIFFLFHTGFIFQVIGGNVAFMHLNNFGEECDRFYTHEAEVKSARWLSSNRKREDLVYADEVANLRLSSFAKIDWVIYDILPSTIDRNAYVYLSRTNMIVEKAFKKHGIDLISYNYPLEFLNKNKNLIYNNGGSEVFK